MTALAAGALFLLALGCSGGPEFNPLPVGAGSPEPVSTSPHTPVSGAVSPTAVVTGQLPTASSAAATPTPTPGLLIFEPTLAPPSPMLDPAGYVMASLRQLEYRESVSVRSTVMLDAVPNAEAGAAGQIEAAMDSALSVRVEGDYSMSYVTLPSIRNGVQLQEVYPSFHLLFFHGPLQDETSADTGAETDRPPDAELEVVEGRFVTNTTGHDFKIHEDIHDLLGDLYPGPRPNAAIFLSLALSGGRIVETHLPSWTEFAADEVRLTRVTDLDGSELHVFEASRSRLNGDVEEWTFWIGDDGLLRRIELSMSNERTPARNIRSAELEFLSIGDCLEGYVCGM